MLRRRIKTRHEDIIAGLASLWSVMLFQYVFDVSAKKWEKKKKNLSSLDRFWSGRERLSDARGMLSAALGAFMTSLSDGRTR